MKRNLKSIRKSSRNLLRPTSLVSSREVIIRFSEVDAMNIVWHGNYAKYLEDGRDAFGDDYDLNLVKVYEQERLVTPIVKMNLDYKYPLKYGDRAIVKTNFMDTDAAKLIFYYEIYRASDHQLVTTAETIQVFLNEDRELQLLLPDFLKKWKEKWGIVRPEQ